MKGFVYILLSKKNGRFYIGSTNNFERRLIEHNSGEVKATKYLRPWSLIFKQEYEDLADARKIEYKLKKYKSKIILEKIIEDGVIKIGV